MGDVVAAAMGFSCLRLTDDDCSGEEAVGATSNLDSPQKGIRSEGTVVYCHRVESGNFALGQRSPRKKRFSSKCMEGTFLRFIAPGSGGHPAHRERQLGSNGA